MNDRNPNGQFAPGVSGNPSGRPAIIKDVAELARQHTTEAIEKLVSIMRNDELPAQARVAAANSILDRGYGKPPQSLDLNSHRTLDGIPDHELIAALDILRQCFAQDSGASTH